MQPPDLNASLRLLDALCSQEPASAPLTLSDKDGVVLYGAGNLGHLAYDFLRYVGVHVHCALDRAAAQGSALATGVPVYPPDGGRDHIKKPILVTTVSAPFSSIKKDLTNQGWECVIPFYDFAQKYASRHPLNNGWFAGALSMLDRAEITSVLTVLADDASRAAFLQFLAWRVVRQDWIFENAQVVADNRFFIKPVLDVLTDREDFVDVGAYDGRVFLRFLEITQNQCASALLIEPDSKNRALLTLTLQKLPQNILTKTKVLPVAISDFCGNAPFTQGFDLTSRLGKMVEGESACTRLDELDVPVSFLKLHIEGEEKHALIGAVNSIRRSRPIIAATIYHNRDGLWETFSVLKNNFENYSLYFRLHSWCGAGAVVYALPARSGKAIV